MIESRLYDGKTIGKMYDQQSQAYKEFADQRFAWLFLEQPAFDEFIPDLYKPDTRVLDIGCGTGVVDRHLKSKGILPENIIGIDPSHEQIRIARKLTPDVHFIETSATEFELPNGSIDLVITNTVIHHLDNESLNLMLERIYDVLSPNGTYFFVEVDPDHNEEGRDPKNTNKWTSVNTPWDTKVPFFNRDPYDLIDMIDEHGFDLDNGRPLKVPFKGITYFNEYSRYASRPSRMAARYTRVSEDVKHNRSLPPKIIKVDI